MEICGLPGPLALQPENDHAGHDDEVLDIGEDIEIVVVLRERGRSVNPRQDEKHVNEGPPSQQKGAIQVPQASVNLSTLAVRLQSQRGHHWDTPEEEKNITGVELRERLAKVNF